MRAILAGLVLGAGCTLAVWGCSSRPKTVGFPPEGPSSGGAGGNGATGGSGVGAGGGGGAGNATGGGGGGDWAPPDASFPSLGDGGGASTPPVNTSDSGHGCVNLQCDVQSCSGNVSTTISGRIMDPAGNNPLYNVVVYIPNSPNGQLDPIPPGINSSSCSCNALFSGDPMVATQTDASGKFTISNAPNGPNIPLVVQIGKWRKEITIPNVSPCVDNPQGDIPLPKSSKEGNIPNIAVSTGEADSLECLLKRVGLDPSEYTGDPNGAGRIHIFLGSGGSNTQKPAGPSSPTALWDTDADLNRYDIVLLSCEGDATAGANPQTMADFVNQGGRVFAEHYHYAFFANQSQFANTADWSMSTKADDIYLGSVNGVVQTTLANGNPFPEGQALQQWLGNVGALTGGQLPIAQARHDAIVTSSNVSTTWVESTGTTPESTQYFSWDMPFNAPLNDAGVPQYCGRVVFSDLHVSDSSDYGGTTGTVPDGCAAGKLSADEDALEFILFDLSSCLVPIGFPPLPPPVPPPPPPK